LKKKTQKYVFSNNACHTAEIVFLRLWSLASYLNVCPWTPLWTHSSDCLTFHKVALLPLRTKNAAVRTLRVGTGPLQQVYYPRSRCISCFLLHGGISPQSSRSLSGFIHGRNRITTHKFWPATRPDPTRWDELFQPTSMQLNMSTISTSNYTVTMKPGLGVTQGHRNRHVSIRLCIPINVPQ